MRHVYALRNTSGATCIDDVGAVGSIGKILWLDAMSGGERGFTDGILKAQGRHRPNSVSKLALKEDQWGSRVFQGVLEGLVGDHVTVKRYVCCTGLQDSKDTDNHEDRTLNEEAYPGIG
jgi:hypothetical protein